MKKLLYATIFLVGFSLNAFAVFNDNLAGISIIQEKQYKKIKVEDVPKDTLAKIKKQYGNYIIKEAYKADDGELKLVLSKEGIDTTATFTSAGELIKIY